MFFHALPTQVYFDLSIFVSDVLHECKWCAAGDLAGCNIFPNNIEGNKQKTKQKMT